MAKYSIGVDYGLSFANTILVNTETGEVSAKKVKNYAHAVKPMQLPNGKTVPLDFSLSHPMDYLDVLTESIPAVIKEAGINSCEVIGIGISFVPGTILPVMRDGTPVCFFNEYMNEPHAYAKLPTHAASDKIAKKLLEIAKNRGEDFLSVSGGQISSFCSLAKIVETFKEAPKVYELCDYFIEASDWVVWQLTGSYLRSSELAELSMLLLDNNYPSEEFLVAIDSALKDLANTKLAGGFCSTGKRAGTLAPAVASALGLNQNTAVSVGITALQAVFPAFKISEPGRLITTGAGCSTNVILSDKEKFVNNFSRFHADSLNEALSYYVTSGNDLDTLLSEFSKSISMPPASFRNEIIERALAEKAGECGIIAVSGKNGANWSASEKSLGSVLVGLQEETNPWDILRSTLEEYAFNLKALVNKLNESGISVSDYYFTGTTLTENNKLLQLFADILGIPVHTAATDNSAALGAAIYGAVAAGSTMGGYEDILTASSAMGESNSLTCYPVSENVVIYERLYNEYKKLSNYFGGGANEVLKRLARLSNEVKGE
jgi:L-ribulokinase